MAIEYDLELKNKCIRFCNNLTLVGDYSRKPLELRPWQEEIIADAIARKDTETGLRATRNLFVYIPRKQGKTYITSALVFWFLIGEGKRGQHIISAASTIKQAALIFDNLCMMIAADPWLASQCRVLKAQRIIHVERLGNKFECLSSDVGGAHGLSPSVVIADEVSQWKGDQLWRVLSSGGAARQEPLFIELTTAWTFDTENLAWKHFQFSVENKKRNLDPGWVSHLYFYDPELHGKDIYDEKMWAEVMPALGDFCSLREVRAQAAQAKLFPAEENTFRMLHLNQWCSGVNKWLTAEITRPCFHEVPDEIFKRNRTYIGVDFASKRDMTAACFLTQFEGQFYAKIFYWIPTNGASKRQDLDKVPYVNWIGHGYMLGTDGNITDYGRVRNDILRITDELDIQPQKIAYDPYDATQIMTELCDWDGFDGLKVHQSNLNLNQACKTIEAHLVDRKLTIEANPVTEWCFNNVVLAVSPEGYIRPSKAKSTEKIDGVSALVNAYAASLQFGWDALGGGIIGF